MAKGKKYDYRIVQDNNTWTVEIVRQKTSKELVVSKSQGGFSTETDAEEWGKNELESFLRNLRERNIRHGKKRA